MKIQDIENQIINADCLDILKQLPDKCIDLVLTDPPYGIGRFGNRVELLNASKINQWDKKPSKDCFDEIFRVSKRQIIWGMNNFNLPPSEYFIVWNKMQSVDNFASAEIAYTNAPIPAKVFNYSVFKMIQERKYGGGKIHPTQKPLPLFEWCLQNYSKEGELILDCFSGSGTTAVACHNMKRRFICIEKDREYWQASVERLKREQAQMRLF